MSELYSCSFISVSMPTRLWEKVWPIASFMEGFPEDTDFEFKVWPKGTLEPEMPSAPEMEL